MATSRLSRSSRTPGPATLRGHVFVTVGSTQFEELIRAVDTPEFCNAIVRRGFATIRLQIGRCAYKPVYLPTVSAAILTVEVYDYKPSLAADMSEAGLIVSHAGAGTVLEGMRFKRPLLVVTNESLMDNHQAELAEALGDAGYLRHSDVGGLVAAIETHPLVPGAPFPDAASAAFCSMLDAQLGFAVGE